MNNLSGTIFSQPWWLNAVAPDQWNEIKIERGEQIVARMPYVLKKSKGFTKIVMPPLTQTLGPWLAPMEGKYVKQLSRQHQLLTELIELLPPFDFFSQRFHNSITNWLPFYWKGFQQTTRYTYTIEDLTDLDRVWNATRANIHRNIHKAQKLLTVRTDIDLETFLDLNEMTFHRQGLKLPYTRDTVRRIDQVCQIHKCRQIFFAEDSSGRLHAAIYIVWDNQTTYYLMSGSDPGRRNSGALSLLVWEAIKFASNVTPVFDFEGSMSQPIERFFRSFGTRQTPYSQVTKTNSLSYKVLQDAKDWGRILRDRFRH